MKDWMGEFWNDKDELASHGEVSEHIEKLEEKLQIAVIALKQYGNISAWIYDSRPGFLGEANGGSIAREALRKLGAL